MNDERYADTAMVREMMMRFSDFQARMGRTNLLLGGRDFETCRDLVERVFGSMARTNSLISREMSVEPGVCIVPVFEGDSGSGLLQVATGIENSNRSYDLSRHIHQAWLCISHDSSETEAFYLEYADLVTRHIPLFVISTANETALSSPADNAFWKNLFARGIHRILSTSEDSAVYNRLVKQAAEYLPEECITSFTAAQSASARMKRKAAEPCIKRALAAAREVLARPSHESVFSRLARVELGMMAETAVAFGVPEVKDFLSIVDCFLQNENRTDTGLVDALHKMVFGSDAGLKGCANPVSALEATIDIGFSFMTLLEEHTVFPMNGAPLSEKRNPSGSNTEGKKE